MAEKDYLGVWDKVVSIVAEDIAQTADGFKIIAQVPSFGSQYPTIFSRVPKEIADQMKPTGTYSVHIVRENLKREKDGSKDWHYYWGLKDFVEEHSEKVTPIDPDDADHLGLEPATQATTSATPPSAMTRTELGMAKGNAISASTALVAAYVSNVGELPSVEFLEEGARLINITSEAILSGRVVEPDAEEPPSDETEEGSAD